MGIGNATWWERRRFAAGVDVQAGRVTLAVVSRRGQAAGPVRIEWLADAPLVPGAMEGAQVVDRAAIAGALRDVFGQLPRACARASMSCAMALPSAATLVESVPLAQLVPASGAYGDASPNDALESRVLAEAERVAGIEREDLAVDWCVEEPSHPARGNSGRERQVTIAAAARQHLEARIECAAMAGVMLTIVDGEAHAALRAMRYAAALELTPHEPYVALWVGADGIHGWRVIDDAIVRDMRYPALEHPDLVEALRDLLDGDVAGCAVVSGEIGLLRDAHIKPADIGSVLGCPVLPFECAALADDAIPLAAHLLHDPACAVAFGLALRGVSE